MSSLGILAVLVAAAITSPACGQAKLNKRIIPGLLPAGDGGLLNHVLGSLDDILGGGDGILGGALEGLGDIAVSLVELEEDVFKGAVDTGLDLTDRIIETVLGLLASKVKGLAGKRYEPELYAEFRNYEEKQLCPVCGALPNAQHAAACRNNCIEQNYKSK